MLAGCGAAESASVCAPAPGWEAVAEAARGGTLALEGPVGVTEIPEEVAEMACALSEAGDMVTVALPWPEARPGALEVAWDAPANQFLSTLTRHWPEWREVRDGRTSVAIMALAERLHEMKASGFPVEVTVEPTPLPDTTLILMTAGDDALPTETVSILAMEDMEQPVGYSVEDGVLVVRALTPSPSAR